MQRFGKHRPSRSRILASFLMRFVSVFELPMWCLLRCPSWKDIPAPKKRRVEARLGRKLALWQVGGCADVMSANVMASKLHWRNGKQTCENQWKGNELQISKFQHSKNDPLWTHSLHIQHRCCVTMPPQKTNKHHHHFRVFFVRWNKQEPSHLISFWYSLEKIQLGIRWWFQTFF